MSETTAVITRIEQQILKMADKIAKLETLAGRAAQNQGGGGSSGSSLQIRFGTTTGAGIGGWSSGPTSGTVNETNAAGTATGTTFIAKNRATGAVGNSKRVICFDDATDIWVIWEDC